jgi:hypothetical protein
LCDVGFVSRIWVVEETSRREYPIRNLSAKVAICKVMQHQRPERTSRPGGDDGPLLTPPRKAQSSARSMSPSAQIPHPKHDSRAADIRSRNALYSKRKYYKKKIEVERLEGLKHELTMSNVNLKDDNARLEVMLTEAHKRIRVFDSVGVLGKKSQSQLQQRDPPARMNPSSSAVGETILPHSAPAPESISTSTAALLSASVQQRIDHLGGVDDQALQNWSLAANVTRSGLSLPPTQLAASASQNQHNIGIGALTLGFLNQTATREPTISNHDALLLQLLGAESASRSSHLPESTLLPGHAQQVLFRQLQLQQEQSALIRQSHTALSPLVSDLDLGVAALLSQQPVLPRGTLPSTWTVDGANTLPWQRPLLANPPTVPTLAASHGTSNDFSSIPSNYTNGLHPHNTLERVGPSDFNGSGPLT